ncbi:MAG: cytochrome c biogenesis protein ResB, partial [Desulfitobacterium hafniense]
AFTGLQIKADPGVGIVWLGSGLLMVGLLLSFYWRPVRIAGVLEANHETQEATLTLGAYTGKLSMGVKEEFDRIVAEVEGIS